MNESCCTHEWVMSLTWMSHVAHMNESCRTHEWVMSLTITCATWLVHMCDMSHPLFKTSSPCLDHTHTRVVSVCMNVYIYIHTNAYQYTNTHTYKSRLSKPKWRGAPSDLNLSAVCDLTHPSAMSAYVGQATRPYESCKIFKGRPRRNAFSKLVHRQYKSFQPDRFCQAEIKKTTGLSNKRRTA